MATTKEIDVMVNENSSGMGTTTVADIVVARIAGLAAREIPGVHALGAGGFGGAIADIAVKMTGGLTRGQGVEVEVGRRETAVDLKVTVDYGVSIPQVSDAVRRNVQLRVGKMTGLTVKEVNIEVTDLYFPNEDTKDVAPRVS